MLTAVRRRSLAFTVVVVLASALAPMTAALASDPADVSSPRIVSQVPTRVTGVTTQQIFSTKVVNATITPSSGIYFDLNTAFGTYDEFLVEDATTHVPAIDCGEDFQFGHDVLCQGSTLNLGRSLLIIIDGTNGTPGIHSITATTCTHCRAGNEVDSDPIGSQPWLLVTPQPMAHPTISVSPTPAAGAVGTTWSIGVTTSGRGTLSPTPTSRFDGYLSAVIVTFPSGIAPPTYLGVDITDLSDSSVAFRYCDWSGQTATCPLVHGTVNPNTKLRIDLSNFTSPAVGTYHFTVSTTSDTVPVSTPGITTLAARAVSRPTVTVSPSDEAGVVATVAATFTVSSRGGMAPGSSVSLGFPGATDGDPNSGSIVDAGVDVGDDCAGESPAAVYCTLSRSIAPGDTLTVRVATIVYGDPGSYHLTVHTSSDQIDVASDTFRILSARPVSQPVVTNLSNTPLGRTDYSIAVTTSSHGGIGTGSNSFVYVDFPVGTVFGYSFLVPTGSVKDMSKGGITVATCQFDQQYLEEYCSVSAAIAAGDHLVISANALTNPDRGSYTLQVSTSSDSAWSVSPEYTITGSITQPHVTLTPSAVAGGLSHYSISFTTSGTGGLTSRRDDFVLVTFPNGTGVGGDLTDAVLTANGRPAGYCEEFASPNVICAVTTPDGLDGGDALTVELSGIFNPSAGTYQVTASTTADANPITSANYSIAAANLVSGVSVGLGPTPAAGARSNYAVTMTTTATGELSPSAHSAVTVQFPTGTDLSALASATVTVAGTPVGSCPTTSGTTLTCPLTAEVAANTVIVVLADGVGNPPAGTHTVGVKTTSDPAALTTGAFSTSAPDTVTDASVSLTANTHGHLGAYTIGFLTSFSGGMSSTAGSTISISFPAGTDLTAVSSATVDGQAVGGACTRPSDTSLTCSLHGDVDAGDFVTVTVKHVGNPPKGSYTASVWTSSDPLVATTASYSIT